MNSINTTNNRHFSKMKPNLFFLSTLFLSLIFQSKSEAVGPASTVARNAIITVSSGKVVEAGAAHVPDMWDFLRADAGVYKVSADISMADWSFTQRAPDDWKNEFGPYSITHVNAIMQIDSLGNRFYNMTTTVKNYNSSGRLVGERTNNSRDEFPVYLDNYSYFCKDGRTGYTKIEVSTKLRVIVNTLRYPSSIINILPIHTTQVAFNTKTVPKNCLDTSTTQAYWTLGVKEKVQSVTVNYSPSAPFSFIDVNPSIQQENTHGPMTAWFDYTR
jgi:hypothetical protein